MTFALITEGISDHRIIKHIITKYFKDQDPDINQIQPQILNNQEDSHGGWVEVLNYCKRDDLQSILIENNYLVIQIDTDCCETQPFGIPHLNPANQLKPVDELYQDVIAKLKSLIVPEILENYGDRIFFAICVHSIECWLLPIYYNNNRRQSTNNCVSVLNSELARRNLTTIGKNKNSDNSKIAYAIILRNWRRKQDIIDSSMYNPAFKKFIDFLDTIVVDQEE